jgi:uroporphyrinogen-III synthase
LVLFFKKEQTLFASSEPRRVLVTRPLAEAQATGARLKTLGFAPVLAPMLDIVSLPASLPSAVQAIVLTSGNAVAALPDLEHWRVRDTPVLAVGDTTAARARTHGFANVLSAGRDAHALVALAVRTLDPAGAALLLACGRHQGFGVASQLRAEQFRVSRRSVYAAIPATVLHRCAEQALAKRTLHAAMFLSAETAAAFVRLIPPELVSTLSSVVALAIGQPAADALKPLPWREIRLAAAPTLDDVLALL